MGLKLFSKSYISIDGSKFKAVNAKDNNLTLSKLDDRIKRLDEHISIYMEEHESYYYEELLMLSKEMSCNVSLMFARSARNVMKDTVIHLRKVVKAEDHADALANGIVPNVIQRDGSCTEQVQFDYNEATITDAQKVKY